MKHEATKSLYCYWDTLRGSRAAPERVDIDPAAIRRVLGDTFIAEVDEHGACPFRLAGTRMCALLGQELRGVSLFHRWRERDWQELRRLVNAVTVESSAVVIGAQGVTDKGQTLELEMLLLPLRHHGSPGARMLGLLTPAEHTYWIGIDPIAEIAMGSVRIIPQAARTPLVTEAMPPAPLPPRMRRVGYLTVVEGGRR